MLTVGAAAREGYESHQMALAPLAASPTLSDGTTLGGFGGLQDLRELTVALPCAVYPTTVLARRPSSLGRSRLRIFCRPLRLPERTWRYMYMNYFFPV